MILRKPYAFFIKHFKLFNIILTSLEIYIIYKLSFLVQFFFEYPSYPQGSVGRDLIGSLLTMRVFVVIAITTLFSILLTSVLSFKKKPIKLYMFITAVNIMLLVLLFFTRYYLGIMQNQIIENRTAYGLRDLLLFGTIVSFAIAFLTSMRSLGFDIKKFEFGQDLHDLNISDADNEEFEVKIDIDSHGFKRNLNRNITYFKYYIKEHKLTIILLTTFMIGFGSYLIYSNTGIYFNTTKVNQVVKVNNFSIGVNKSFITSKDYRGNTILKDTVLVVVPIKVKTNFTVEKLNIGKFTLMVGHNDFNHTTKYNISVKDLGIPYNNTTIEKNFEKHILVFEIPKALATRKMFLEYYADDNKKVTFDIKKINVDNAEEVSTYNLNDNVALKNTLVQDGTFVIKNFEIADRFKVNYKFCISNNECYDSYEYVVPNFKSNYDKTLIKISGSMNLKDAYLQEQNLGELINNYGKLIYTINGENKISKVNPINILPVRAEINNTYYVEAPKEMVNAEHIIIQIRLRNNIYNYNLK